MGTKADEFDSAMRNVLTRNTPAVLASFVAEVEYAIAQQIGPCKDWTAVKPRQAMSRVASLMSGRAFVGLPLSRNDEWVEATVNYTQNVSWAWMILNLLPKPVRFIVAPFLPQVRALKKQRAINEEKLAPLLAERDAAAPGAGKKHKLQQDDKQEPGGDLIDWFISQYKHRPSVKELGRDQLLATFASIYNLSNALSYIVFDLAATDPRDVEAMRQEIMDVIGPDGTLDKNSLVKLRKLDSFAKESQRLSPPSLGKSKHTASAPTQPRSSFLTQEPSGIHSQYPAYRYQPRGPQDIHGPCDPVRHAHDHQQPRHQPGPGDIRKSLRIRPVQVRQAAGASGPGAQIPARVHGSG